MTLVDLLAGMEAEAAAEAALLEAETREEAARIVEAARAEALTLQEQAAAAGEAALQREAEQRRALARLAAAAVVRGERENAFRAFLAEVHARLDALRGSAAYPSLLRALIRESLAALPDAMALRVDPRDERLTADLLGELDAELEVVAALETAGGVELEQADGRTVRNTIEERLANAEPALRLLFSQTQAGKRP
jgi:V/A-type H+/Na+-transporting ATPase subunit E